MDGKIRHRALEVSNGRLLDKPINKLALQRHLEAISEMRNVR